MSSSTEIGRGTFGIIFTDETLPRIKRDVAYIIKRTIKPNVDPRNWIREDAFWHETISTAMAGAVSEPYLQGINLPCVPDFLRLIEPNGSWWSSLAVDHQWITASHGDRQRDGGSSYVEQSPLLSAQRIPNVKPVVAQGVLQQFCKSDIRDSGTGLHLSNGVSVLFRIYFGQNTPAKTNSSLQNFPLYRDRLRSVLSSADQTQALKTLASGLAFLHWHVRCDAKDVEFVFGGLNPMVDKDDHPTFELFGEKCHMWLLDFNQVEVITMDIEGVELAVLGFENDPYYPKLSESKEDWTVFKDEYLSASQKLLESATGDAVAQTFTASLNPLDLPRTFIRKIEEHQGLNRGQRALEFASFGDTSSRIPFSSLWLRLRQLFQSQLASEKDYRSIIIHHIFVWKAEPTKANARVHRAA